MTRRIGGPLVYTPAMARVTSLKATHVVKWTNPHTGKEKQEPCASLPEAQALVQALYRVGVSATIEAVA